MQAERVALVLNGLTSAHSRRSCSSGLKRFFAWIPAAATVPIFSRALSLQSRAYLLEAGL